MRGESLSCDVPDVFPLDVPVVVIEIIKKCMSFEMDDKQRALERQSRRPKIGDVLDVVTKAREEILDGKFDIFLSYNWGPQLVKDKVWKRQELVKQVYKELKNADYIVWLDCAGNMQTYMDKAMREGIENSSCVVLFLSPEYCTSDNCLKELQFAHDMKKPIIVCMTENNCFWKKKWTYDPPKVDDVLPWTHKIVWDAATGDLFDSKGEGPDGDIVRKLDLLNKMFCDFKLAYEVDWASKTVTGGDRKRVFYDCATAMPQLLHQIRELPGVDAWAWRRNTGFVAGGGPG